MSESNMDLVGEVSAPENNQFEHLAASLEIAKVNSHPFGDFAGALSWSIPLTVAQQKEALHATSVFLDSLDFIALPGAGVLDYLDVDERLANEALSDPLSALARLINSPRGQALGLAIQTRLNGIATDVSAAEYAMAGIHLSLHQGDIDQPSRSKVAGFDLAGEKLWGKPPLQVFDNLVAYLIKERLSSRRLAGLTAALLLVRKAPEFLIKKFPPDLKYGTTAWFNLTVAARTIEAYTPGKVAYMTFAQVMASTESASLIDSQVFQHVQAAALADWGVVNGVVQKNHGEHYTRDELERAKTHFNLQLAGRLNTSILLNSQLPSRKAIALDRLQKKFKGDIPFEERLLEQPKVAGGDGLLLYPTLNGRYSLLDIVMMGGPPYYQWTTRDPRLLPLLDQINAPLELGAADAFQAQFENAIGNLKQGALLFVKHLIAELPLQDRKNLEHGHVSFYQYKTYRLSLNIVGRNLISTSAILRVKVDLGQESKLYDIDLKQGVIRTRSYDPAEASERTNASVPSIKHTIEPLLLADQSQAAKLLPKSAKSSSVPVSYSSERTELIAQAFVQHLDLDNEDILQAAKGQTTQDGENAFVQRVIDFVVDLIPFKTAIANFVDGNYADGAVDLFFDVLGFVTAGASVAGKLARIGVSTASAISKTLKAAKIIGAVVITELNPLIALRDVGVGATRLLGQGLRFLGEQGLRQIMALRRVSDPSELLRLLRKEHGPALIGTWKINQQSVDGIGVLKDQQWHHYNPLNNRLYGAPGDFRPKPEILGVNGFTNSDFNRFAIKPSVLVGLESNARGIFRSADGQRFYIRNIDAAGKEAVYGIRNDFNLADDFTDVVIVDPATNRTHGARLWQVAPDQWQPVSLRGGELPQGATDVRVGATVDESTRLSHQLVYTSSNPLLPGSAFMRHRLPNGLWEPVIEVVANSEVAHLAYDCGLPSLTRYSLQRTGIHEALSPAQLSRLPVATELLQPGRVNYSAEIASQLANQEGGASFVFVMERVQPANSVRTQFNALKIHDPKIDKLPQSSDAVVGYWAAQGGYVDIPVHPKWGEPDHLFTPGFSGCSLVVDQLDASRLRVRHVEGGKELAQYNGLATHEHGLGLSASMEYPDYGLRVNANGQADSRLLGFAFMKYDRAAQSWKLHFQASEGAGTIIKYSSEKPGWITQPDTLVSVYPNPGVIKTVTRPVPVVEGATAA
ncbi:hypothetical protein [Pseudomonas mercuritolerans]|uniref:Uncharacterized protein n=1 Tax=Pseudomonas mercuritolerans TaxID=2951809 RepID=A0ABT2XZR4_9PSED|nr:hypothetical protein [Pseudomonas mercuritolerans]MCV2224182.1 hypothetical protein [Pseudomonas mercuritolerans]